MLQLLRDWLLDTSLFERRRNSMIWAYHLTPAGRELLLALKITCASVEDFLSQVAIDGDLFLDVLDYTLANSIQDPTEVFNVDAPALERILHRGRSAWMVSPNSDALTRRLPEETHCALEEALAQEDAPAQHLADAWQEAWSRKPNPSASYLAGVKAIESAIRVIVSPNNPKATLGTMIKEIEHKPSKWQTRFDGDDSAGVVALTQVLQAIWQAHERHGTDEYASVTLEQARDVCHVALWVVNLANSRGLKQAES